MLKNKFIFVICILLLFCLCSCQIVAATTEALPTEIAPTITIEVPTPTKEPIPPTPIPTLVPTLIPTPTEVSNIYVVKTGDTLWSISQEFGKPMAYIALQNGINYADQIKKDQVLTIPDSAETPPEIANKEKLIVVVLSSQKTYAYENGQVVDDFIVSTGLPATPTVQGLFYTWVKYESTSMTGPGYHLDDVRWTMYFFEGYGLHTAYWHNNFGQPMSHGCVNMREEDAKWLFDWAPLGTAVLVLP